MTSASEATATACRMAYDYHRGNLSPRAIVESSGYRTHRPSITLKDLFTYLKANPGLVDEWWMYSDNKRTSSGWFFDLPNRRIGYFERGHSSQEEMFEGTTQACAAYVQHELDSIIGYSA